MPCKVWDEIDKRGHWTVNYEKQIRRRVDEYPGCPEMKLHAIFAKQHGMQRVYKYHFIEANILLIPNNFIDI